MNDSLNKLITEFWNEAKRQGLIIEHVAFNVSSSLRNEDYYALCGQEISAKLIEKKGE